MKITKRENGNNTILEIDEARIVYRNFSGTPGKFNANGERSFAIVIPEEYADGLEADGWHVKRRPAAEEGEEPFNTLPVKVKYTERMRPTIYLDDGENIKQISEEVINMIDDLNISSVDMDIRPYHWTMAAGNSGITAYLQSMCVHFTPDRFARRMNDIIE